MCDFHVCVFVLFFPRDGIPPYKLGTKKQLQREMHRSVKINGQITLPHFPVSPTSLSYTSRLCFLFFVICQTQTFYTLTDNWVPSPSRGLCFTLFHFSSCCVRIHNSIPPLVFI